MSNYNLVYRGGKQQPGIRDGPLAIARASRRLARLPRNSSQSHKENKPPEEFGFDLQSQACSPGNSDIAGLQVPSSTTRAPQVLHMQHNTQSQDIIATSNRLPPSHRSSLRTCSTHFPVSDSAEVADVSAVSEVPASPPRAQASSKRGAEVDRRPIDKNKKQRIEGLLKAKDRLRKQVGRVRTKIHTLEANLADAQRKLTYQQLEHKNSISQLVAENAAAEKRAQRAETRMSNQQDQIQALYARTRAIAIGDARYKANEARRIEAEVTKVTEMCLVDRGRWTEPARRAVRNLYNAGCAIRSIERVLTICSELLGVDLVRVPSTRTITRMILEGGVLAELQIIQELMNVDGAWLHIEHVPCTYVMCSICVSWRWDVTRKN